MTEWLTQNTTGPDDERAEAAMTARRLLVRLPGGEYHVGQCEGCGEPWVACYGPLCVLCWDQREWAEVNGCGSGTDVSRLEPDVERIVYDCPPDAAVELYVVEDGGHTWPGTPTGSKGGRSTQTISATDLILDFFDQHPG